MRTNSAGAERNC